MPDIPEFRVMNKTLMNEWGRCCYLYVAALSATAEFKINPDFLSNKDFAVYEDQVVNEVFNSFKQSAIQDGLGNQYDENRAKSLYINDWNLAKSAMMDFIDNLSKNRHPSDLPLMHFLFRKIGTPDIFEKTLEAPLRSFTKETLKEFVQQ